MCVAQAAGVAGTYSTVIHEARGADEMSSCSTSGDMIYSAAHTTARHRARRVDASCCTVCFSHLPTRRSERVHEVQQGDRACAALCRYALARPRNDHCATRSLRNTSIATRQLRNTPIAQHADCATRRLRNTPIAQHADCATHPLHNPQAGHWTAPRQLWSTTTPTSLSFSLGGLVCACIGQMAAQRVAHAALMRRRGVGRRAWVRGRRWAHTLAR